MKIGRFETNNIYNEDCYKALKDIPDNSIDCIYTDIPYLISNVKNKKVGENASKITKQVRASLKQLVNSDIVDGIDYNIFYDFKRIMKNINCFIWCSKEQIYPIMKWWAENSNATLNILVWCKKNPMPKCNGTWLPDVEYCLYFYRGTKLNDGYNLKSKWYLSEKNVEDKKKYDHPTIKPLDLVERHLLHTTRRGGGSIRYVFRKWNDLCCC